MKKAIVLALTLICAQLPGEPMPLVRLPRISTKLLDTASALSIPASAVYLDRKFKARFAKWSLPRPISIPGLSILTAVSLYGAYKQSGPEPKITPYGRTVTAISAVCSGLSWGCFGADYAMETQPIKRFFSRYPQTKRGIKISQPYIKGTMWATFAIGTFIEVLRLTNAHLPQRWRKKGKRTVV